MSARLARISDSKQDFNGFPDPAIAANCGFIHHSLFGPGFWILRETKKYFSHLGFRAKF